MKYLILIVLFSGLILNGCNQHPKSKALTENQAEKSSITENSADKDEIQKLIQQVLKWSDSEKNIDFLPVLPDSLNSLYIGFDMSQHKANLEKLRQTDFFSSEFIENYNQIILTLDKKLKNKDFNDWLVGDMLPFAFFGEANPWCLCQDVPYDNPDPWGQVEVEIINLKTDSGELNWKWGNLKPDYDKSWKMFRYKFKVVQENGKWKISYLRGFDFEECTK